MCSSEDKKSLVMLKSVDSLDDFARVLKGSISIISDIECSQNGENGSHEYDMEKYKVLDVVLYQLLKI